MAMKNERKVVAKFKCLQKRSSAKIHEQILRKAKLFRAKNITRLRGYYRHDHIKDPKTYLELHHFAHLNN
jgi:hypothetical protein